MPVRFAMLVFSIWIGVAGPQAVADPPTGGFIHEPTESYDMLDLHGFTVRVSAAARANPRTTDPALELLERQLAEIVELIPAPALEVLRGIPFWIEHENPDRPCACYHVSAQWLRVNGYNIDKARSVEVSNCDNFVSWINRTQPMMVLHELAHGYHDIVFGYRDEAIRACFERADKAGLYDMVPYTHGGMRRHYALSNAMEYFAELSEAYFGRNDFFPFTRDDLRRHDPVGFAMIERAWSLDGETIETLSARRSGDEPWFDVAAAERDARLDLLIVAPARFAEALGGYIGHKSKSLRTEMRVLETILDEAPGVDDPERLKRGLHRLWRDRGVRYVLLVGDADTLPVRYMVLDRRTEAAFHYAFYPSDLYYADLAKDDGSFDNWNARNDGFHAQYFGEVRGEHNKDDPINFDGMNMRPNVAVGRWPVSSIDEVKIVVEKSIAYEQSLATSAGGPDHVDRSRPVAALLACGEWIENRPAMDRHAERLSARFDIEKRYFADARRDDGTPPPDADEVVSLLNSGARLVLHSGHGHDHNWHGSIHIRHLDRIDNAARLPILFSVGCSTARFATLPPYEPYIDIHGIEHIGTNAGQVFDHPPPPPAPYQTGDYNPTGFGEQFLRAGPNGAVAYIGCNTGSQPCGMTLLDGFIRAIASDVQNDDDAEPMRLGDAWNAALLHYIEAERLCTIVPTDSWYPASIFFQPMKFMLYGDPSLALP